MKLVDLPRDARARVVAVHDSGSDRSADVVARRLRELGFVSGEPVRVSGFGPFGRDPLLVRVGTSSFALRRSEAARIEVEQDRVDMEQAS
ncbi:MAG: ferrous iron transport protein A [Xanthomonadales bacterium]|nr:ferrous iron transport protein A [Xanthomonadales bacterium]